MLHRIHEHKWIVRLTTSMAQQCRHTPSPPDPTGPLPHHYLHVIVRCISPASLQQPMRLGGPSPEEVAEVVAKGRDQRGGMSECVFRTLGCRHGRKNMLVLLEACRVFSVTLTGVFTLYLIADATRKGRPNVVGGCSHHALSSSLRIARARKEQLCDRASADNTYIGHSHGLPQHRT